MSEMRLKAYCAQVTYEAWQFSLDQWNHEEAEVTLIAKGPAYARHRILDYWDGVVGTKFPWEVLRSLEIHHIALIYRPSWLAANEIYWD